MKNFIVSLCAEISFYMHLIALASKLHFLFRILELSYTKLCALLAALTSSTTGKTGLLLACLCRLCVQPSLVEVSSWHVSRSPSDAGLVGLDELSRDILEFYLLSTDYIYLKY